jgi:uncharacterized protein YaaQ
LNVAEFAAWFGANNRHFNNDVEWFKETDQWGNTPLHIGMQHKAPVEVIKLLVEACSEAAMEKGKYGKTPLFTGMYYKAPAEVIKLLVEACPENVKVQDKDGNTPLHIGMQENRPAEVIKLLVDACPAGVKEQTNQRNTPLDIGMKNNAPPLALEVLRHPSQPLWILYLKEGPAMNVAEFAAWFGKQRWVAKSKDKHGTTPLQLATKHNAPAAVLELLRAAQDDAPLTTQTLGGDTLHLRGWEDAWAAPGANLADALVSENPVGLQGVYGNELEPVLLNPTTMELSPVLFRPLVAVEVKVVGVGSGGPTATLSVRLALEGGTVGYVRHKIGGLVGGVRKEEGGGGGGRGMHAGRVGEVRTDGTKRKLRRSDDGALLQAAGVAPTATDGSRRASLLYERHRTWKGAFRFAPKYELMGGVGGGAAARRGGAGAPAVLAVSAPAK